MLWVLYTLYPQPADLIRSVYRLFNPPVNPYYVSGYFEQYIDVTEPYAMDALIREKFPYQYDWVTYNRPWYFPTAEEAFRARAGDCKTRLLILSSLFEWHGIPYTLSVSPTHVWVEYEGKPLIRNELPQLAMISATQAGLVLQPPRINLGRSFDSFWTAFWHSMPDSKKVSLVVGLLISLVFMLTPGVVARPIEALARRRAGVPQPLRDRRTRIRAPRN